MADAEALLLSSGLVPAGSGPLASTAVAQTTPDAPLLAPLAVADSGQPQTGTPKKPDKAAARNSRIEDTRRSQVRRKPKPDHQRWAAARPFSPHIIQAEPYPPARIIVPAGYGRQPYVIQPQGVPYRTY